MKITSNAIKINQTQQCFTTAFGSIFIASDVRWGQKTDIRGDILYGWSQSKSCKSARWKAFAKKIQLFNESDTKFQNLLLTSSDFSDEKRNTKLINKTCHELVVK